MSFSESNFSPIIWTLSSCIELGPAKCTSLTCVNSLRELETSVWLLLGLLQHNSCHPALPLLSGGPAVHDPATLTILPGRQTGLVLWADLTSDRWAPG